MTDAVWFYSYELPGVVRFVDTGSGQWAPGLGVGEGGSHVFHKGRVSIWEDGKFWKRMAGWLHSSVNVLRAPDLCAELQQQIVCYVHFTTIKNNFLKRKIKEGKTHRRHQPGGLVSGECR